ncbi:MAG: hypothetical protein AAFY22_06780 [Pseudomonadota bacterium]
MSETEIVELANWYDQQKQMLQRWRHDLASDHSPQARLLADQLENHEDWLTKTVRSLSVQAAQ